MKSVYNKNEILDYLKGNLIASCQALENEPLYGSNIMVRMATAVMLGGAKGIRANSVKDINAIQESVNLPIIGIIKKEYEGSECYITPSMKEVSELVELANPHIVAVDGTSRMHPDNITGKEFIQKIKMTYPDIILMADISTLQEALDAEEAGADLVSTTLSGYTPYSPQTDMPDFKLMEEVCKNLCIPVIGEGKVWDPEQAVMAFNTGIHALVVGTAITRPLEITKRFVTSIKSVK